MVVDDHELLRAGTRRILDDADGFSVVGDAGDGEAALRVIADTEPDVVLVDIRLPTMNGIELARRIAADFPRYDVLILSAYDDENYVRAALAAGVAGYLLKTMPSDELIRSIRAACDGSELLDHGTDRPRGEVRAAESRCASPTPDGTRAGGRAPGRPGNVEQGHRQPTRDQPAHRRGPPQSCVRQARHDLPHRARPLRPGQQPVRQRAAGDARNRPSEHGGAPQEREATRRGERRGPTRPSSCDAGPSTSRTRDVRPAQSPSGPRPSEAPWTNSRFWILQLVILALYLIRLAATVAFHLDANSQALEFSTLALFLVPVVYATLNYGLQGAIFTAGWVTLLAVPRFLSAVQQSQLRGGLGRAGPDRAARRPRPCWSANESPPSETPVGLPSPLRRPT